MAEKKSVKHDASYKSNFISNIYDNVTAPIVVLKVRNK